MKKCDIPKFSVVFSSLKQLIEKPPIGNKEILPLTTTQLSGFRLLPGSVSYQTTDSLFFGPREKEDNIGGVRFPNTYS